MPWQLADTNGNVEVLEKLWDWPKRLQLKPEDLSKEMFVSQGWSNLTAWQMAAESGQVQILKEMLDWVKEMEVKPQALRNGVFF
jgi:hypothetical protein